MNQPNVNPSPKAKFVAIKHCVDQHRELIARPDFRLALETAQSQMVWLKAADHVDGNAAAATFYKLQGVHEFLSTLMTLAEQSAPITPIDPGDISHTFK